MAKAPTEEELEAAQALAEQSELEWDDLTDEVKLDLVRALREATTRASYYASDKGKATQQRYNESDKGRVSQQTYNKSDAGKAAHKRYQAKQQGLLARMRELLAQALQEATTNDTGTNDTGGSGNSPA